MNCSECKSKRKKSEPIPYIAYESSLARLERTNRRLWIIALVLIFLFCGSNAIWIFRESQYADEEITQIVDTDYGNAYVSGVGDVNYGESSADN